MELVTGVQTGQPAGHPSKIAIVGAGSVGATLAYACLMRGLARTVALYDINTNKVRAEALDLGHGSQFMPAAQVIGSDDIEVCRDADIVVVTAGAKQRPGQSRMELAEATIDLTKILLPQLIEVAPDAIYLMVTNPVDVVTYAALKISELPANRVFGSGTVLDSSRLRYLVANKLDVAVQNVHAYIAGEHGDSEIPLWSSAFIGSVPLLQWNETGRGSLNENERKEIEREVITAAYQVIEGKGATNYAIGMAGARIIEAVLKDEKRVLPVSSLLNDYAGIDDVCLSVPTIVGRDGIETVLPINFSIEEHRGLMRSADAVRSVAKQFGL